MEIKIEGKIFFFTTARTPSPLIGVPEVRRKISMIRFNDEGVRAYSYIINLKGVTQMRHCAHQSPPSVYGVAGGHNVSSM